VIDRARDFLARALPRPVRRLLRAPVSVPARLRALARLHLSGMELADNGPAVHYGGVLPRAPGAIVNGGKVKLTHLDRIYPEQLRRYNLLYLVSSAIPPHALDLVRFAKRRGARLVWNQNGVAYPAWAGPFSAEVNQPMRELLALADHVVYQSAFCRVSADRFLGAAPCPATVLFNPVDTAFFAPPAEPLPGGPLRLLAMGTHTYPERVLGVLRCLEKLRATGLDAVLTVAGPMTWPGAEAEVQRCAQEWGLSGCVTRHPAFSQAQAARIYREHHVLLHPKYMDPCPTVVIEALASGLPVVGPQSGGLPELLGTGEAPELLGGCLVPVPEDWDRLHTPDPGALAGAVLEIARDLPAWQARARAGALRRFAVESWLARHREIFENLAGAVAPGA
jgi:glycosyltransferase involved in cell wall biosynthesis